MLADPQVRDSPLRGLVLAPYGRDAALLASALAECEAEPVVCRDLADLIARMRDDIVDLLVISDDALAAGGDDRLLKAIEGQAVKGGGILPLVLLTATSELVHPLTRLPSAVVIAKPTRRGILNSALRGAMDARRIVLQLQSQRRELEERSVSLTDAIKVKDRFVSTMSHELRTPLNAVLSYADLLDLEVHGPLNERQRAQVHRIAAGGRHLLELINQILDYAKLNQGQASAEPCALDLRREVEEAVYLVSQEATTKGLHLSIHPPSEPLPSVWADRLRVRQILLNLLSNAIKFTDDGGVTVHLRREGDRAVSALVQDTGIGIEADHLPHLFHDFYQVDGQLTRTRDGSGLGLAISKRLALLMGGELSAASLYGRGSVFTFTLPLASIPPEENDVGGVC
jgi:signal transduction histidine kinase